MAEWKKVVVSGSGADLTNISASGHILPKADDAVDLGSSTHKFKDLYIDGTGNFDAVNIDGGTIDGATIATSDITVGTDKTLDVSGGTLTLANDQISGNAINGGTIGSITISQLAGALDANSQAITNVDINSGAIDGAAIGAASPDTGVFTTLSATGDVSLGNALADDINVAGHITGSAGANVSMSLASTGSFGQLHATKLFGDGANITGIAFQIDGLSNSLDASSLVDADLFVAADATDNEEKKITFGNVKQSIVDSIAGQVNVDSAGASTLAVSSITAQTNMTGDVADEDELLINDNGALKRIDFSVLRDAVFNDVDGDIAIAAGGTVTIQANSVALGNDTTGNFMADVSAGTGISVTHTPGEGSTATIATNDGAIVHDNLSGFVANEHIDHTSVTMTAGNGLTGGGDISSTRTFAVGAGTGVTVNADDIAIGQDVAVTSNVRFADLVVDGNLTVKGDTTQVQVANLNVEDPFILLGSGSAASGVDTGIIFASGSGVAGAAFGFDMATKRFVYNQHSSNPAATTDHGTAEAFASIVVKNDTNEEYQKSGNIRVDESADEIYIYVE